MKQPSRSRSFRLERIAETGDRFSDFMPYVASINNRGVVAFQAALTGGGEGIFVGSGGSPELVARTRGAAPEQGASAGGGAPEQGASFRSFSSHPDIDDAGAVCFYAGLDSGVQGVFLVRSGELTTLADTSRALSSVGPLGPTMSIEGVAYRAETKPGESGIFCWRGATVSIAGSGGAFAAFGGLPVVNRRGEVVFFAELNGGGQALYVGDGDAPRPIATTGDRFHSIAPFASMNDDGMVAFAATLEGGRAGIFIDTGGRLEPVVTPDGAFESLRGAMLDNTGRFAFAGTPRGGTLGVFRGPDPVADRVLFLGDRLFGAEIKGFALNPVSINDLGQLAIRLLLSDDRQLIVRVDPEF